MGQQHSHFRTDSRTAAGPGAGTGSLMLGVLSGAVLGAAGLGWWLLSEAERRRRQRPFAAVLSGESLRPFADAASPASAPPQPLRMPESASREPALQERVQQLNQAIDEVRRQLEALQPQP